MSDVVGQKQLFPCDAHDSFGEKFSDAAWQKQLFPCDAHDSFGEKFFDVAWWKQFLSLGDTGVSFGERDSLY